jgi:hypothetical protein
MEFQLNEKIAGNKFYHNCALPIEDEIARYNYYTHDDGSMFKYIQLKGQSYYKHHKKMLIPFSPLPSSKHIYKVTKPLNIFMVDVYHINKLKELDLLVDMGDMRAEEIVEFIFKNSWTLLQQHLIRLVTDVKKFMEQWDGFYHYDFVGKDCIPNKDRVYAFYDNVKDDLVLFDGMVIRAALPETDEYSKVDFEIPDWVLDELHRYTLSPSVRINKHVVTWLEINFKKPYETKTLYRGMGIHFDDNPTVQHCNKILKQRCSISLEGIKQYNNVVLKRGKASSWSTTPIISKGFATGMAQADVNFLFKAEIPADQILVDFTILPDELKTKFKYHMQNECILNTGSISATISDIWYDRRFTAWLNENGYTIKNRNIIPKNVMSLQEYYNRKRL